MTIKIEKISASVYKTHSDQFTPIVHLYWDTQRRVVSSSANFVTMHNRPMSNNDWEILKSWCREQQIPFPHSEPDTDTLPNPNRERYSPEVGTWVWIDATKHDTLPVVKRGVQADSVNVTLAKAETGQYRIEWRNSESGKTRFIVHCFGCANSLQVARGIAFAQCAKITHPMSKPTNDLSDHP
jgi:hypothetical protein